MVKCEQVKETVYRPLNFCILVILGAVMNFQDKFLGTNFQPSNLNTRKFHLANSGITV